MWPFDSEEETQDTNVLEFKGVANDIASRSTEVGGGLAAIRDAFSSYEFQDTASAKSAFLEASDSIRQRFQDTKPFDAQTTQEIAPINIMSIAGEGETEDDKKIDVINRWETDNLKELETTNDLTYMQSSKQLTRSIQQQATMMRRDIYGGDNTYLSELPLRMGQGLVGGVASLVGADSVNDFFVENTSEKYDDDFWANLAGGAGSVVGAVGAGLATLPEGGVGALAYLGASGGGAVVQQVRDSLEAEATVGEALAAGGIEAASQGAQALVGAGIFGKAATQIGKAALKPLGAKIFPAILKSAAMEGATEGAGQFASNVADYVGQDDQKSLGTGVLMSAAVGGVLAGGSTGISQTVENNRIEINKLKEAIEDTDGAPPPPKEAIVKPFTNTEGTPPTEPMFSTPGGVEYSTDGNSTFIRSGDNTIQREATYYVNRDYAEKLHELKTSNNPDGTSINIITEDGKLYAESEFLNDDLTLSQTKTGKSRVEVPGTADASAYAVSADSVKTQDGVRQVSKAFISPEPVTRTSTAGAADIRNGTVENKYGKRITEMYGPELAEEMGAQTTQTVVGKDGKASEVRIGMWRHFPFSKKEGADLAERFIAEKGDGGALAYLQASDQKTVHMSDPDIADALLRRAKNALINATVEADQTGVYDEAYKLRQFIGDVEFEHSRISNILGTGLSRYNRKDGKRIKEGAANAEVPVATIKVGLMKEADEAISVELGEKVNFQKINEDNYKANEELKAVEQAAANPEAVAQVKAEVELEEISKIQPKTKEEAKALNQRKEELKAAAAGKTETPEQQAAGKEVKAAEIESLKATKAEAQKNLKEATKGQPKNKKEQTDLAKKKAQLKKQIADLEAKIKAANDPNSRTTNTPNAAPLAPEVKDALKSAAAKARAAKIKLDKANKIRKEHLSKFSPDAEKTLRNMYEQYDKLGAGFNRHKMALAIAKEESKYFPPDTDRANELFTYWRNNVLSGPDTQMRNLWGNFTNVVGTSIAMTATGAAGDIANIATLGKANVKSSSLDGFTYARAFLEGMYDARTEFMEVLKGNLPGRMKLDMDMKYLEDAPSLTHKFDKAFLKNPTAKNVGKALLTAPTVPWTMINQGGRRLMAATDSLFYKGAENGMAYLAEHIASKDATIPDGKSRREWVQERLYQTGANLAKVQADIAKEEAILGLAGIKMTKAEKTLAEFTRMEQLRSEKSRVIGERAGSKGTYMHDPEGALGVLARGLTGMSKEEDAGVTILGRKFQPLKHVFPFVRTIANVGNSYLDVTPAGFYGAKKLRTKQKAAKAKLESGKTLNAQEQAHLYSDLEQRELFGRAMVGTAMIGGLFSIGLQAMQDKDPPIQFYGNVPPGKWHDQLQKNIPPFSVRFGDTIIGLQGTPLALLPAILAPAIEGAHAGKPIDKIAFNTAISSMGAFANITFVKNVSDFFNTITSVDTSVTERASWENYGATAAANQIKPWIPSSGFLQNVGRWMESSPTESYNNFSAKLLGQMPFARDAGIGKAKLNMFGEKIERDIWDRTAAGSFWTDRTTHPTMLWMMESGYKITDQGPVLKLTEAETEKYGDNQPEGYADIMTAEQSRDVLKISGPEIRQYLDSIRGQPRFQTLTEEGQKVINKRVNEIRARAKAQVLRPSR